MSYPCFGHGKKNSPSPIIGNAFRIPYLNNQLMQFHDQHGISMLQDFCLDTPLIRCFVLSGTTRWQDYPRLPGLPCLFQKHLIICWALCDICKLRHLQIYKLPCAHVDDSYKIKSMLALNVWFHDFFGFNKSARGPSLSNITLSMIRASLSAKCSNPAEDVRSCQIATQTSFWCSPLSTLTVSPKLKGVPIFRVYQHDY